METAPQVVFKDIPPSKAIERAILEKIEHLEKFFDRITSCRVVIKSSHRRHEKGNLFHIQVDLRVPGNELVVKRDPSANHAHEDVYVAIRDAFNAMERQLKSYIRRRRRKVKRHEGLPRGRISELLSGEGYGFITTLEGRRIYFHKNSLRNGQFEQLQIGSVVEFVEEMGKKGPQAGTVHLVK